MVNLKDGCLPTVRLHVLTCHEMWEEKHERSTKITTQESTFYAWLSSEQITEKNAAQLCAIARRRQWIESNFNTLKNDGYAYSHCFSYNWNAMKCYHILRNFARFLNAMVTFSGLIIEYTKKEGIQGLIHTFKRVLHNGSIGESFIRAMAEKKTRQWKMVTDNIFLVASSP